MEASQAPWILRHFGLMAAAVWSANGVVWWFRGTRRFPDKTPGYRRLVTGFLVFGNLPWLCLESGLLVGAIERVGDLSRGTEAGPFVPSFYGLVVALLALGTWWIFARRGAEALVDHPGLLNYDLQSPRAVRVAWLGLLAVNAAGLMLVFLVGR